VFTFVPLAYETEPHSMPSPSWALWAVAFVGLPSKCRWSTLFGPCPAAVITTGAVDRSWLPW
jgi:hypothetical protein